MALLRSRLIVALLETLIAPLKLGRLGGLLLKEEEKFLALVVVAISFE